MRERITSGQNFLMLFVAAGFDFVGALASGTIIGGSITGLFGNLTFFLWYLMIGGGVINPRVMRRAGINSLIELIPFAGIWLGFSYFVWKTNKEIMQEDAAFNAGEKKKAQEAKLAGMARYNAEAQYTQKTAEIAATEQNMIKEDKESVDKAA